MGSFCFGYFIYRCQSGTVYIKFTMGPTNSSRRFSGWNIDDLEVTSEAVYPSEGTYGTELDIRGLVLGQEGKGINWRVLLLTVLEWTLMNLIKCRLKKVLAPGIYDVMIQPGEPKGSPPIVYEGGFYCETSRDSFD